MKRRGKHDDPETDDVTGLIELGLEQIKRQAEEHYRTVERTIRKLNTIPHPSCPPLPGPVQTENG